MAEAGDRDEAAERLRRHWDGVVLGAPTPDGLDPVLAETVRRLHALDGTPGPSRATIDRIWGELMGDAATPTGPMGATLGVATTQNGRVPHLTPGAVAGTNQRRPSPVAELATAALVVLSVALAVLSFREGGRGPGEGGVSGIGAPAATARADDGVPGPEECRVAPRSRESALALLDNPAGPGAAEAVSELATALPAGPPADAATVAAVTATIRELHACENAGDPLRGLALMTDRHLRLFVYAPGGVAAYADVLATPAVPHPLEERSRMSRVRDARVLSDGRVGTVVEGGGTTAWPESGTRTFMIFAAVGDRYLIDDAVPVAPAAMPEAATPRPSRPATPVRPNVDPSPTAVPVEAMPTATVSPQRAGPRYEQGEIVVTIEQFVILRAAPSTGAEIVEELPVGTRLQITGELVADERGQRFGWWPVVEVATGVAGYVSDTLVAVEEGSPILDALLETSLLPTPEAINVSLAVTPTVTQGRPAPMPSGAVEGAIVLAPTPTVESAVAPTVTAVAPTVTAVAAAALVEPPTPIVEPEDAGIEAERDRLLAEVAALQAERAAVATAIATEGEASTLEPAAVTETIRVDPDGLLVAEVGAEAAALEALHRVLDRYEAGGCRVGFMLISGYGEDVAEGVALARATELLLRREFGGLVAEAAAESRAVPGGSPRGQVELRLFLYRGCTPDAAPTPTAMATAALTATPAPVVDSTVAPVPTVVPAG